MTKQVLKPVLIGILVGAALFIMPFFLLRALLFFLLIGGLIRLFRGRVFGGWYGHKWGYGGGFHPAFADTIRNMSEEEYKVFRQKFERPYHTYHSKREDEKTENK